MAAITPDHAEHQAAGAPLNVPAIRATVDRALRPLARPTRPEMVELEQLLREHIGLLLLPAETAVDGLWRGSVDWWSRRDQLDRIRRTVGQGLGDSPLSAHVQVRHLAHDCSALLNYLGEEER